LGFCGFPRSCSVGPFRPSRILFMWD